MMKFDIDFVKTKDLLPEQLDAIANIKDQHWKYGYESQKVWIKNNLLPEDTHLMLNSLEGGGKTFTRISSSGSS